ncbi:MAG TPA: hypothetical protein V6D47_21920 [Oscillatoriaceae cyanobacterium]
MIRYHAPLILLLAIALSGCSLEGLSAGAFESAQTSNNYQGNASGTASATANISSASLPFRTILDDRIGISAFHFQTGSSETAVLHSQSDLNAFLARHPRIAIPLTNGKSEPPPDLPDTLTKLDFSQYVAVAAFDGDVRQGATTRIVSVKNQGNGFVARVTRWEPPDNANVPQDICGRMHIIALPLAEAQVSFAPETIVRQAAGPNEGGVSVHGGPVMDPRWPAVPNPDITKDKVETIARGGNASATVNVQLQTLQWLSQNVSPEMLHLGNFTPDSLVWYATITGSNLSAIGPSTHPVPGQVGGGPPPIGEVVQIISPEDGHMLEAMSKPVPGTSYNPGFRLQLSNPFYLGDKLTFTVTGEAPDGTLTMTLTPPSGPPIVKQIAYKDLSDFSLPLDPAHVTGLADVSLQTLKVQLTYENTTETHTVQLVADHDVQQSPLLRATGKAPQGSDPNDWTASASDADLEPLARDIATTDWKGQNLTITHQAISSAQAPTMPNQTIPDGVVLEEFDVKGTFPKFLVPAVASSTGADAVMQPTELKIVLSQTEMIHVVSLKAYE